MGIFTKMTTRRRHRASWIMPALIGVALGAAPVSAPASQTTRPQTGHPQASHPQVSRAGAVILSATALQKPVPAIAADPAPDADHPARMAVLHVPVHGLEINAIVYVAAGPGPHPTLVLLHGLPGNEKNLDVAQAARRAGWNAVTFNYRGSWGSPGKFRFSQNPEDAEAVLAYLRDPDHARELAVDVTRIAIAGHSMGGWATAQVASRDHAIMGAALISMADFGLLATLPRPELITLMAENKEALAGVTPESMADDVTRHKAAFALRPLAPALAEVPLLVLTCDDGLGPQSDGLVAAIKAAGGSRVTSLHVPTDHGWNDKRVTLSTVLLNWLATLGPVAVSQP